MCFKLVPKVVTSNDLERHNGFIRIILAKVVASGASYVTVVEDRLT